MCIFSICVTDLASAGLCGRQHLVNSFILQGVVTAALSVCIEQMCFIGTGSLVHLCLCKLQWY